MTSKQQNAETAALFERLIPGWDEMLRHMKAASENIASLNGVHSAGLQPRPFVLTGGAALSQRLTTSPGTLRGWSIRETTGGVATVRLRSGSDVNGDLLLTISLAGAESTRDFPTLGIAFGGGGLYLEVVAGTIEGTAFVGPVGK